MLAGGMRPRSLISRVDSDLLSPVGDFGPRLGTRYDNEDNDHSNYEDLLQRPVHGTRSSTPRGTRPRPLSMVSSFSMSGLSSHAAGQPSANVASELDSVREQIKQLKLRGSPGSQAAGNTSTSTRESGTTSQLSRRTSTRRGEQPEQPPTAPTMQPEQSEQPSTVIGPPEQPRDDPQVEAGRRMPRSLYSRAEDDGTPSGRRSVVPSSMEPLEQMEQSPAMLTRQTGAERHLLTVMDRARKMCDRDMLIVMLERVAADTVSLYNHSSDIEAQSIDRVCLSLADAVLQYMEMATGTGDELQPAPAPAPVPPVTRRATIGQYNSDDRRLPSSSSFSTPNPRPSGYGRPASHHTRTPSSISRSSLMHSSPFYDRDASLISSGGGLRSTYDRPSSRIASYSRDSPLAARPPSTGVYARRRYDDPSGSTPF